ncbi:MAG: sigma-70 family RNA polymerase sigma factor [Saprospiraceae bacterium]|nr:sigma-70 family RNA polymerase sigma factor [Saprospiraceae bacterium]
MSLQTFNEQILPLKDKLYRFSLRIVGSAQDAEDVVQEVMVKIWKKRDVWHEWTSIEAMCMTITRNLSIDKKRSKHKRVVEMPDHYDEPADTATPDQVAVSNDLMQQIRAMMDELPEKQKLVIQLRDIEGYAYKEIAEILDVPLNQVKISLHRARLFLKEKIVKAQSYGF